MDGRRYLLHTLMGWSKLKSLHIRAGGFIYFSDKELRSQHRQWLMFPPCFVYARRLLRLRRRLTLVSVSDNLSGTSSGWAGQEYWSDPRQAKSSVARLYPILHLIGWSHRLQREESLTLDWLVL